MATVGVALPVSAQVRTAIQTTPIVRTPIQTTPIVKTPIQTIPIQPIQTIPVQPIQTLPTLPIQTIPVQPIQTLPTLPIQTLPTLPIQTLPTQPIQTLPTQPIQTLPTQPIQTLPTQPIQTLPTQPIQTLPTQPIQIAPIQNIQTTPIQPALTTTTFQPALTTTIQPALTTTIQPIPTSSLLSPTLQSATTLTPTVQAAALQPALLSPAATGLSGFVATPYLPATTIQPAPSDTVTRIYEPLPASAMAGGLGAIVAPGAAQSGVVGASVKRQQLGARDTVSLDLYGDQLVSFAVSDAVAEQISRAIGVGGSQVALTAGAAKAVVDNVVNLGGKSRADTAVKVGDKVMLGSADEIAAADDRTSKFVNSGTFGKPAKAGFGSKVSGNVAATRFDWAGARSDASLPLAIRGSAFASSNVLGLGPSLAGVRSFPPLSIFTPPGGFTAPPGTTLSYFVHRPGAGVLGGVGVNVTLGLSGLPPGTVVVTYAMTHRPGNGPAGASAGVAGNSGSAGVGGQGGGQGGSQGGVPGGAGMVVALTEIVPSPFDLNDEASPARFMLTGSAAQAGGAQGISGGRGVASAADLGRGNQAGTDAFANKQHVVEAPGCRSEFAGFTYFTRDVFGRELITVCTLASASAVAAR